ncbi:hypothetical protein HKD37_02G004134 [Glycine soja]
MSRAPNPSPLALITHGDGSPFNLVIVLRDMNDVVLLETQNFKLYYNEIVLGSFGPSTLCPLSQGVTKFLMGTVCMENFKINYNAREVPCSNTWSALCRGFRWVGRHWWRRVVFGWRRRRRRIQFF